MTHVNKQPIKNCGNGKKLRKFDSNGKIYFPKFIRELFRGYYFSIEVVDGKIVLDPVKIEDFCEEDD